MENENIIWFEEKGSHRRRGKITVCEFCNKEFVQRINAEKKYCSKICSSNSQKNRIKTNCRFCGKEIERCPSDLTKNKHQIYFCSIDCKNKAQSLSGNCPEIRPSHYGTSEDGAYRYFIKRNPNAVCVGCGESRKFLLRVHHIDGNRSNNENSNLEPVCSNCHAIRHLKFDGENWFFWTASLTPRDKLYLFYK